MSRSSPTALTADWVGPQYDLKTDPTQERAAQRERRRLVARDAANDPDRRERRQRPRAAGHREDAFDEFVGGSRLLRSLDAALALQPSARNRALARIVLGVEAGIDQERDADCQCMAPDLGALITLMDRDGVDEDTHQSALELAEALRRLAEHGGLDEGRRSDMEGFAARLQGLPKPGRHEA